MGFTRAVTEVMGDLEPTSRPASPGHSPTHSPSHSPTHNSPGQSPSARKVLVAQAKRATSHGDKSPPEGPHHARSHRAPRRPATGSRTGSPARKQPRVRVTLDLPAESRSDVAGADVPGNRGPRGDRPPAAPGGSPRSPTTPRRVSQRVTAAAVAKGWGRFQEVGSPALLDRPGAGAFPDHGPTPLAVRRQAIAPAVPWLEDGRDPMLSNLMVVEEILTI